MIVQLSNNSLYSTFGVSSFSEFELNIQNMAPSMVEYYLSNLSEEIQGDSTYLNKSNIQQTINIDEYDIHLDYNNDIYLEFVEKNSDYETLSFW